MRRWVPFLRVAGSAALIAFVLQRASLSQIFQHIGRISDYWPLLVIALAMPGVAAIIAAFRWKVLLGGLGARASNIDLVRAILVGTFFNSFLPSTVGGDVARSWWMQKAVGSATLSLAVVALDRLIGVTGICAVGLTAAALRPSLVADMPQFWLTILVVGIAVATVVTLGSRAAPAIGRRLLILPFVRAIQAKAEVVYTGFASLRGEYLRLAQTFLLSALLQAIAVAQFFILATALGLSVTAWQLAILVPVVTLVTLLPITINGIGLREASLAVVGAGFGLSTEDAIALAWLFLGFQLVYALIGSLIYLVGRPRDS